MREAVPRNMCFGGLLLPVHYFRRSAMVSRKISVRLFTAAAVAGVYAATRGTIGHRKAVTSDFLEPGFQGGNQGIGGTCRNLSALFAGYSLVGNTI